MSKYIKKNKKKESLNKKNQENIERSPDFT